MEVMFSKSEYTYLQTLTAQTKSQELTQELRIPDSMPDIGRSLNCWGQVVVRGKEWKNGGISVSGGIMIWCLYSPEDGTELRCADTWIPFQCTWDFPESSRDGAVYVTGSLKSLDARCISARKLMIRAVLDLYGEALEPQYTAVNMLRDVPDGIELLRCTYPLEVPEEAGEKAFQMEDVLSLPVGKPAIHKIVCARTALDLSEQRVMTNKLVFRGTAKLNIKYLDESSNICSCEWKQPFSQLADLDRDYGTEASAWIMPIVTGQDLELMDDGQLQYKIGVAAQYIIYDRKMLDVIEDAYCVDCDVDLATEEIMLPVRLDVYHGQMETQNVWNKSGAQVIEVDALQNIPDIHTNDGNITLELNGQLQILYMDENDMLQVALPKTECEISIMSDAENHMRLRLDPGDGPRMDAFVSGEQFSHNIHVEAEILKQQKFTTIVGINIGETKRSKGDRPSIILKRGGEQRLWDIAKHCNSTVQAIKDANGLTDETVEDRLLLIPVK